MGQPEKEDTHQRDPIQDAMGQFGRWQLMIAVALAIVDLPLAWHELAMPVLAPGQDFTCVSPAPFNSSDSMLKACYVKVNESLPAVKCEKFTYDTSSFKSTIISEWDLVCDRKILRSVVQPSSELAIFIGTLTSGVIADKIGRKIPLITAIFVRAVAGTTMSFMTTFELFLLCKLVAALATGGTMQIGFSIVMEIVGIKHRSNVLIMYQAAFALGFLTIPAFSYFTRTWDGYCLSTALPSFLLISYYWFIPESPRWFLARGRLEDARQVLLQAAKWNKIPTHKVTAAIEDYEKSLVISKKLISDEGPVEQKSYGLTDLMRSPIMRTRTLIMIYNWFKDGVVFYGLEYYLGRMSENVLTNLVITALFQFPALFVSYFLAPRVSRLKIVAYANILSGLSILLIIPCFGHDYLKLAVVAFGSLCLSVSFYTGKVYTGELFPTVVRAAGVAVCSMSSNVGCIISPFLVEYVDEIAHWIIPALFGVIPIIGAVFCYWLPETLNRKLPETIEEVECSSDSGNVSLDDLTSDKKAKKIYESNHLLSGPAPES